MNHSYQDINKFVSDDEARAARIRAHRRGEDLSIMQPEVDLAWAQFQSDGGGVKPYYDYFYSGEDIRVYVGETADDPEFGDLPIMQFAYSVQQEKMPIYGYWNYTYNTVLRGTRLVSGAFTLVTKHPNYMKDLLATAAKNRSANHRSLADDYPSPSGWREDDKLIEEYWGKNLDESAIRQQGSLWSIHPPFSLVVVYGIQDTSMDVNSISGYHDAYSENNQLFFDRNERLIEDPTTSEPSRVIIDGCELKSIQRSYSSSELIFETYEFFGRDEFVPTEEFLQTKARQERISRADLADQIHGQIQEF